jgi:hypothetical protein
LPSLFHLAGPPLLGPRLRVLSSCLAFPSVASESLPDR